MLWKLVCLLTELYKLAAMFAWIGWSTFAALVFSTAVVLQKGLPVNRASFWYSFCMWMMELHNYLQCRVTIFPMSKKRTYFFIAFLYDNFFQNWRSKNNYFIKKSYLLEIVCLLLVSASFCLVLVRNSHFFEFLL